jgi:hypothetical protein
MRCNILRTKLLYYIYLICISYGGTVNYYTYETLQKCCIFQHLSLSTQSVVLASTYCSLHVLLRYFHLTNFFWMFVEGELVSPKSFFVLDMTIDHIDR